LCPPAQSFDVWSPSAEFKQHCDAPCPYWPHALHNESINQPWQLMLDTHN
jgi:hypothetical protein